MVLDKYRSAIDFVLTPVAKIFINVNPNMISLIGLILAFISGSMVFVSGSNDEYRCLLLIGALAIITSGYFDALDGKVAKISERISRGGDYIDHVFDRYSDVFMIGSVAFSSKWCDPYIGMLAIIGVLLTSYMGTQAQAIGINRLYNGFLGRADRIVLLFISIISQFIASHYGYDSFRILGFDTCCIEIVMVWFAIIGNITAIQRVMITWADLCKK